ncbi:MAG: hypothetical protein ACRYFU_11890 [Janthinobacterium lividum]
MRLPQKFALLWAMLTITGCRTRYPEPEKPMPPNTLLLSEMMRQLSAQPGFTEHLLQTLEGSRTGKKGPALLTPDLIHELRKRILGKDWQGLDRFPGWTMREINPTVRVAGHFAGKNAALEGMSSVHPGAPAQGLNDKQARAFLDLGPYPLDHAQTVSLDQPSSLPPFTTDGLVTPLGMGVQRGDGPNALAPEHAESQRLADVLNRLSANQLDGAQPFTASIGGHTAHSPQELVAALTATGHTVAVHDARYFANFGHLHFNGQDVMMPFWINTQIAVPGTGGLFHRPKPLLVPVSHAEYEWEIRGPHFNADVSHYFGIDGKAEWRTMDTLDQAWVLKRYAHTYTDAQATEVTRLISLVTVAYMHQHAERPKLPFGGYYALGVCQDPVSAIEKKMTGRSTLFPNTADSKLFDDPRDVEVNALFTAIPKDRAGAEPQPERIFGSLPVDPGREGEFSAVTIPGLASDLHSTYTAWQEGKLRRTHGRLFYIAAWSGAAVCAFGVLSAFGFVAWRKKL